ncbi:MAG: hypothetical protein FWB86_00135 [Treponema sp.]|nr:hypothetical protein [Treponema sp.]MCL2251540.1 hypothetical protein [Treponema sp.]
MKNKIIWLGMLIVILVFGMMVSGCEDNKNLEPLSTIRYETIPYLNNNNASSSELIFCGYDNDKYYYIFLLGHVNHVPIAYRPAVEYNGITPITITYEKSNVTEESVRSSMTTTIMNSVSRGEETNWNFEVGTGAEATAKVGTFGASLNSSITASKGGSTIWDTTNTRSVSDTFETTTAKITGEKDITSATIGTNGEPSGQYRYTFFGTTDVYYVLITNKEKEFLSHYFSVCARNNLRLGIDYDPDLLGSFEKTGNGDLLKVPNTTLFTLPIPTKKIEDLTVPKEPDAPLNPPIKTSYSETRSEYNGDFDLTYVGYFGDLVNETYRPYLSIHTLKQEGYTHLKIDVSFDYRATSTLFTTKLRVKLLNNNNTNELSRADFNYQSNWTRSSFSRTVPIDATDSITGDFMISWGVVDIGALYSVYSVGNRTITITAIK